MEYYSSSSSTVMSQRRYDAFLSFRGLDARHTIISHLYRSLSQKGIFTFKDSESLDPGHRRSEVFHAIHGSRVAIVTFSQNYARSKWCLDELHHILDCRNHGSLTVIPIFYRVSPSEVRLHEKDDGGRGCFQIAMDDMDAKYGKDSQTVRRWRNALWQGGDLIGIQLDRGQDEGYVVQQVVEKVLKLLNRVPLEVAKYPVGMTRHLMAIRLMLHIDPHVNDVYMVGLLGLGGVGKTTLSKAICNDVANRFESWCFLPNVSETTTRVFNGLVHLQQTLLRELLSEEKISVLSIDGGKQLIKQRLCNKRVLVILDDINEPIQLDALAGNLNWFGAGSRIIITTRNDWVLAPDRVQHVYSVELLDKEEANNLFHLHAFGESQENININRALISSFLEYVGALPLAIVVLGEFLRGRSQIEWEGRLKELAESPDKTINSVLKISFDGLEDKHKEIFLDVACFFKGWTIVDVEKILDSCGFATSLGIKILVERSLVAVDHGKIQMHDLLEAMGKNIIRDKYLKGNRMLSRVWLYEDILDILSEDRVNERQAVRGIVLNFVEEKVVPIKNNALLGFKNLRFLIVRNVVGPKKKLRLPREMRWLEWRRCSASAIEFDPLSNLVGINLEDSMIRQMKGTGFKELKYVNLSRCYMLHTLLDLSQSPNLEELNLSACNNLTCLDKAIGGRDNLVHMDLGYFRKRTTVPSFLSSKHLQTLDFSGCSKLYKLPAIEASLQLLVNLDLSETAIKELPDSIGNLVAVKKLLLFGCTELTFIPSSIYRLQALERLEFINCSNLSRFPRRGSGSAMEILGFPNLVKLTISHSKLKDLEFLNDLTCYDTLTFLDFSDNSFTGVPACISKFINLEELQLCRCKQLKEVLELPSVSKLSLNACRGLRTFPSFHSFIYKIPKWFWVDLSNCHGLDRGYIDGSLPLEKVRGFVGSVNIVYPGEEFPQWVIFHTTACGPHYRVSLPQNISEDDFLGLMLFVSFDYVKPLPKKWERCTVNVMVNHIHFSVDLEYGGVGIHTWFVNILPLSVFFWRHSDIEKKLNKSSFTLEFSGKGTKLQRWGMHLLCKQEQDDRRIKVRKAGDKENGSSRSEHELQICF